MAVKFTARDKPRPIGAMRLRGEAVADTDAVVEAEPAQ